MTETKLISTPDSIVKLAEKWERLAASWLQVARDRNDDAPEIANRAQARAAIYQDCAEDLRSNINNPDGWNQP